MKILDLRSATSGNTAADLPLADNVLLSPGGGIINEKQMYLDHCLKALLA